MAPSRKQLSTDLCERLYIASRLVTWSRPDRALGPVRLLGPDGSPSKRPESPVSANQKISTAPSSIVHRLPTTACHRRPVFLIQTVPTPDGQYPSIQSLLNVNPFSISTLTSASFSDVESGLPVLGSRQCTYAPVRSDCWQSHFATQCST